MMGKHGIYSENYKIIISKTINAIKIKINFLFKTGELSLFLKDELPQFRQTIFPPKERSATNAEPPHRLHILFLSIV